MGKHTHYWKEYTRAQVRGSLRLFAVLGAGVAAIASAGYFHEPLGVVFPWLMSALLLGLGAALFHFSRHVSKVVCPECGTVYQRSKWHGQCPNCGLKLMQADP